MPEEKEMRKMSRTELRQMNAETERISIFASKVKMMLVPLLREFTYEKDGLMTFINEECETEFIKEFDEVSALWKKESDRWNFAGKKRKMKSMRRGWLDEYIEQRINYREVSCFVLWVKRIEKHMLENVGLPKSAVDLKWIKGKRGLKAYDVARMATVEFMKLYAVNKYGLEEEEVDGGIVAIMFEEKKNFEDIAISLVLQATKEFEKSHLVKETFGW